jgi:hypothetical protein
MKAEQEEEKEIDLSDSDSTEVTKVTKPALVVPPSTWSRRDNLRSRSVSPSKTVSKTSISGNQKF